MYRQLTPYLSLLFLWISCITSCKPASSENGTPTYVRVDSITIKAGTVPLSTSSKIDAVWAYWNNTPIAILDLPAIIPILATEKGVLSLSPAVRANGLSNFIAPYPFYKADTFTIVPQPKSIINHSPACTYFSTVQYNKIADFNSGITRFKLATGTVEMQITTLDSQRFEGNGSGIINLHLPNDTLCEDTTLIAFTIPANKDVYLEFNYKNTVPFAVGLRSNITGYSYMRYLAGVYPSAKWSKFYVPLRDFAGHYPGDRYTLYIKAQLPEGYTTGTVFLDNIQLIYFN
ncbi:MAG: hypothetical protein EBX41_03185 [Chitinophagia bacterium]|nr:hypothetical protein [Chitinophagia bacterium]